MQKGDYVIYKYDTSKFMRVINVSSDQETITCKYKAFGQNVVRDSLPMIWNSLTRTRLNGTI